MCLKLDFLCRVDRHIGDRAERISEPSIRGEAPNIRQFRSSDVKEEA
jgi:hypothetical protein